MVIWLSLRWWYGAGWQWAMQRAIVQRLQWCNETFSMAAMLRTLFAPFKQTYNNGGGSIDVKLHAFMDNIISRFVGFFARSFILFTGFIVSVFALVTGAIFVVLWPLIPAALPISLILIALGVGR